MTDLESKLTGWTGPSSSTEQEKQERTERMVKEAINAHSAFEGYNFSVFAKGSYPNNTNVRADSDVDIAVQCHEVVYFEEETPGDHGPSNPYTGVWTPTYLRSEVEKAMQAKFLGQVDTSGNMAIAIESSSARVDADVVPCFNYEYHWSTGHRNGTRVYGKNGKFTENFPVQQLANGRSKNLRTNSRFKQAVRILKRVENEMVDQGVHREVPSFLVECMVYNCPDSLFGKYSWTDRISAILVHIWDNTQGDLEPENESDRWLETSEAKYLFHGAQKWTRKDVRDFSHAAWNHLGYGS